MPMPPIHAIVGSEAASYISIKWQDGPIKEVGVNGCQNEDLIQIIIVRLKYLNAEKLCCRENSIAITKLEEALLWLNERTRKRVEQGVEGTSQAHT